MRLYRSLIQPIGFVIRLRKLENWNYQTVKKWKKLVQIFRAHVRQDLKGSDVFRQGAEEEEDKELMSHDSLEEKLRIFFGNGNNT